MEVVERVRAVRERYPRWGREKLRVLLSEEGITISAKSIDRVIGRLKGRGVLREAVQPRKAVRWQHKRLRRPKELVVDSPGALVQMDSKHVALGNGKVVYQFGAVDYFTRKRVVALAPRLTSHHGAEFLRQVVTQFPFHVQAIQSDGGSEFMKEFGAAIAELQLTHYFRTAKTAQQGPQGAHKTSIRLLISRLSKCAIFAGCQHPGPAWGRRERIAAAVALDPGVLSGAFRPSVS